MGKPRGKAYSQDLRDRVLDATGRIRALAERFGVSASYVSKAQSRLRRTGERSARPAVGRPGRKLAPYFDALRARLAELPDQTLQELRGWLAGALGVSVSIGCLWDTLRFLDLRLKKSLSTRPNRSGLTSLPLEPAGEPSS